MPLKMGRVNCYLIYTDAGFILVDTGTSSSRKELVQELEKAGCKPGLLKLIILTHGDFDHIGNAAFLREVYDCKIAMHAGDAGMAELGDMFYGRQRPNILVRMLLPVFSRLMGIQRFSPDILVIEGQDLSDYGWDARIISIPGHSQGSIGILTKGANLFCGDLFENNRKPALNSLMDNVEKAKISISKLVEMEICMVYPGHGKPFSMDFFKIAA